MSWAHPWLGRGIPGPYRVFRTGIVHDVNRIDRIGLVRTILALAHEIFKVLPDVLTGAVFGELEALIVRLHDIRWPGAHVDRVREFDGIFRMFFAHYGIFHDIHYYIPIRGRDAFFSSFGSDSAHMALYFVSGKNFPST